jgi:hypothetical protein
MRWDFICFTKNILLIKTVYLSILACPFFSSVMNHCNIRDSEAYCREESHAFLHEQADAAQLVGISLRPIAQ